MKVDYKAFNRQELRDTKSITGVPIDKSHEFAFGRLGEIDDWIDWFMEKGVPFALLKLPNSNLYGIWKHQFIGSYPDHPNLFCCGAKG